MEKIPSPSPETPVRSISPGNSSFNSADSFTKAPIHTVPRLETVFDTQLRELQTKQKSFGFSANPLNPKMNTTLDEQIKTVTEQIEACKKIETIFGGIPIDTERQQLLSIYPEIAPKITTALKIREAKEQAQALGTILYDTGFIEKSTPGQRKALKALLTDLGETNHLKNVQFNRDQLGSKEIQDRRSSEIAEFQKELSQNPDTDLERQYPLEPATRQLQAKYVESAQEWASKNGFENTQWWPSVQSGKGMLFCADWEPITHINNGPLKISRRIGIMLGDRVRIIRITAEIPGKYTLEQAKEMMENFNTIKSNDAAEAFKKQCEESIQEMHAQLISNTAPQKAAMFER